MAARLGDNEAASRQRSAENPFACVDWIGSILLPAFLIVRGQAILGWTRFLDLDHDRLRRPCRDGLLVAASGPLANLFLALAGIAACRGLAVAGLMGSQFFSHVVPFFCAANASLAVFNLLPIPPLAASMAAELFLEGDALSAFEDIKPYGFLLLLAGAYLNFFDFITMPLNRLVYSLMGF